MFGSFRATGVPGEDEMPRRISNRAFGPPFLNPLQLKKQKSAGGNFWKRQFTASLLIAKRHRFLPAGDEEPRLLHRPATEGQFQGAPRRNRPFKEIVVDQRKQEITVASQNFHVEERRFRPEQRFNSGAEQEVFRFQIAPVGAPFIVRRRVGKRVTGVDADVFQRRHPPAAFPEGGQLLFLEVISKVFNSAG